MERYLFIAEKPSLMRDIQAAYKAVRHTLSFDADFTALRGHFMELQEPQDYNDDWGGTWKKDVLPMIPDDFKYKVKNDCKSDYNKIKDMINKGKYDFVVNACDAGREGQAIFWTFYNNTGCKIPVKRIWASDNTVPTLGKALGNLLDEETGIIPNSGGGTLKDMKFASLYRMYFDWLIGMNLTRAISLQVNRKIPVGRVMSPTLNIVVQRDLEINNFVPKDYFEICADFTKYKGNWFNPDTNETNFSDKAKADTLIKKLGKTGKIETVETEKVVQNAPTLYSLPDLQTDANRVLGFTAKETLNLAQKLYEDYKLLSYPRTESRVLSTNLAKEIDKRLSAVKNIADVGSYVKDILSDKSKMDKAMGSKKYVDNKKITDHHAIIPTETVANLTSMKPNEVKLYLLVVKRFVSIFLDPYVTNKTTIVTDVDGEKFKTVGSVLVDIGYRKLYDGSKKDDIIPDVKVGETVNIKDFEILSKKTTPPKPFTDGDLIKAMEHAGKMIDDEELKDVLKGSGLGTSATRDSMIEKLIRNEMLFRKGKTIRATDFGFKIIEILDNKDIISPILTAEWENKLRNIESGELKRDDFYPEMIEYVEKETDIFLKLEGHFTNDDTKVVVGKCPKCNSDVVDTGKYYKCKNYKKEKNSCDFIFGKTIASKKIPQKEAVKILEGKPTSKMKFKSPKSGKTFECSLIYDKTTKKVQFDFGPPASNEVVGKCPECGKNVLDKGKYFACENYKEHCTLSISKEIKSAKITKEDIIKLSEGKETDYKKFSFGEAKLKYNKEQSKLDFIFKPRPKK